MSIAFAEMERRHVARKACEDGARQLKNPGLTSKEAMKLWTETRKKLEEAYDETLLMLTTDCQRLIFALRLAKEKHGIDYEALYNEAVDKLPVSENISKILAMREEAIRQKEEKKNPDTPGQTKMKIKGDDGSQAEAASECSSRPLEEDDVLSPESKPSKAKK